MLDLPEQLVPFKTMQVAVIPQGCLKTQASCVILRHSKIAGTVEIRTEVSPPATCEALGKCSVSFSLASRQRTDDD
jgi:hypothetical protein